MQNLPIAAFVSLPSGWNWSDFQHLLPNFVCIKIAGFVKLNSDGALDHVTGLAFAEGYSHMISSCSALEAECWGVLNGLKLAWELGYKHVELECDSTEVIAAISGNSSLVGNFQSLAVQIREANFCANWLAHSAPNQVLGVTVYDYPPVGIFSLLLAYYLGFGYFRDIVS
ncbi:conserved hypothetical protein [Ricinus communis]|uniref:RNase H type-1 domain-containing protein n=1 Tax=Ricinus communis TaxID=3988 RepID=B9REH4_RICCO|nr:conserved hypothetical protein [Ricinus communis]